MLTVYKASAGSGKTFQLVVEYLKIILNNPYNYKHILAVTFTNKATNEMKSRILEQLHLLATEKDSAYIKPLQEGNKYTEQFIRQRAKEVLKNILHDYNRFSINTIDSFTQKVIKAFNRELGISPNFTVELDNDILLQEAADRLLARINEDKNLLQWLRDFSKEKIEANRSQRIDDDIKNLGKELFKESFQVFFPDEGESVYNRQNLNDFGKELRQIIRSYEKGLKEKAQAIFTDIAVNGFSVDDFSYKKSGVAGYIQAVANGEIKEPGARVLTASENTEKWYAAKHKQAAELYNLVENKLRPALSALIDFYESNSTQYNTAQAVLRQLRMLGILSDLKEEIAAIQQEKGALQLSDSNLLLSKIIGQSDSPFVYEKIGNYYKHFMLDEFQDTSGLQWRNFKPLLDNSLAEGNANLIVGDVKQSIYRWRNSDWSILAEQLDAEFSPAQKQDFTLEKNWRSDENIIAFNNAIFGELKSAFENYLIGNLTDNEAYIQKFDHIYSSYKQDPGKTSKEPSGFVQVNFLPEDDFEETSTERLVEQVKHLQDEGIKAKDIAILIRKNKEGGPIIEAFLAAAKLPENKKYNLSVLSNESLFLFASKAVLFVINTIELLIDPENKITQATLLNLWQSWLKPGLKTMGISVQSNNGQSLLDFNDYSDWNLQPGFDEEFHAELHEKLEQVKHKVLLTSLDETITHICSLFGLFNFKSELPFLQTLIDKAGELKSSLSNDLSNLIYWWNEKGSNTSVNVNEELNSIRLMTVHKSKGLEFKAVLLPYLDWKTSWSGNTSPLLWCKPLSEPFNKFPLLPIQAGKQMELSEFAPVYYQEKMNYYIDTLNLIYVAFTRAESVLMANCPEPKESRNNSGSGKPIHYLLHKALINQCYQDNFSDCMNEEQNQFEFGNITIDASDKDEESSVFLEKYCFNDISDKISLRLNSDDFLIENKEHHSEKNTGKIIHDILAKIVVADDAEAACLQALHDGKLSKEEFNEISESLQQNLELPEVKSWFDGSYQVLNERDLLSSDKLLRPDRIMFSGDEAIVVDYKTGEKHQKYIYQVKEYAKVLTQSGIKNVSGYLWYLNTGEIEQV
ncbi:UvrD-helicase domain-containing protein [Draconibacterium sp. IB214405]|uniref:UvrD-helicase domain-containing protein n=1 Tax=Draconibacterium sp. IB214405 TaxID=3097352 RepID=UPI002A13209E|nr:UvrD-helicase domain-containing protein [Draconibacterium sp. IB214405]MDX8339975.1 UvrD-helicase domain-containing protein [Draconibacterium sp. IB214405]